MWKDKMKALLIKRKNENPKRTIENLVVFILILVITIISINTIWKEDNTEESNKDKSYTTLADAKQNSNTNINDETEEDLEKRLENILQKIEGVGEVKVLITYSSSNEIIPMYNESSKNSSTTEEDSGGGTRIVEENDTSKEIVYTEENGKNVPVTKQIVSPKIEGAIITASGATDAMVKTNIIQAVEAVTGIATHKIQVFEMKT